MKTVVIDRLRRFGWALPLVLLVVVYVREQQAIRAARIDWSEFKLVDGMYVPPESTPEQRTAWRTQLEAARKRVARFYGPTRAHAPLIFSDAARLTRFTANSTGVTHYLPTGAVVVLGPAGQNIDVIAHELAHAELFARLGYWKINWCVPTWFDEGLAVQFDERPFYTREALHERIREGWKPPPLATLDSRDAFFAGGRDTVRFHYAWSRAAIGDWLATHSPAALQAIETVDCGDHGNAMLREIERTRAPGVPATNQ